MTKAVTSALNYGEESVSVGIESRSSRTCSGSSDVPVTAIMIDPLARKIDPLARLARSGRPHRRRVPLIAQSGGDQFKERRAVVRVQELGGIPEGG